MTTQIDSTSTEARDGSRAAKCSASVLSVTSAGWKFRNARIIITHPLGLYMNFSANHHNALAMVAFGQECIRDLENEHATDDWSV